MIQDQISTSYNYHPSRVNFFNITANRVEPSADSHRSESPNPHSKLQYIGKSLQKFAEEQLIGLPYVQAYLLAQYRRNRSINPIRANFGSIYLFLKFIKKSGQKLLAEVSCDDLSAYIESMQDQGKKPLTVHTRLRSLKAFFNYHIDRGKIDPAIFGAGLTTSAYRSIIVRSLKLITGSGGECACVIGNNGAMSAPEFAIFLRWVPIRMWLFP